jgi:hypothetical protein
MVFEMSISQFNCNIYLPPLLATGRVQDCQQCLNPRVYAWGRRGMECTTPFPPSSCTAGTPPSSAGWLARETLRETGITWCLAYGLSHSSCITRVLPTPLIPLGKGALATRRYTWQVTGLVPCASPGVRSGGRTKKTHRHFPPAFCEFLCF